MSENKIQDYIKKVLENKPTDWLSLTTHRLDIYDESQAKTQFIDQFTTLYKNNVYDKITLQALPTAYDYIRLGHPLSCILEWAIANLVAPKNSLPRPSGVISFSSQTTPILAILRKNALENKNTRILYTDSLPKNFDVEILKTVYGYTAEVEKVKKGASIASYSGSTIFIQEKHHAGAWQDPAMAGQTPAKTGHGITDFDLYDNIDFYLNHSDIVEGSILLVSKGNENYISEIQHARRRETIAMTPINCHAALAALAHQGNQITKSSNHQIDTLSNLPTNKAKVQDLIKNITATKSTPLIASSGLSIQYAIMMGLVHHALEAHPGKDIKFIVPPNCYGGTNDQARRVAACIDNVEVVDLPVDGDNDMVQSVHQVLDTLAKQDAVPYIIAEIPTNPRVEVPDLQKLKEALATTRQTADGTTAIAPVFILDQTFCPNFHFLGEGAILSTVSALSYASGSKFPSGGKCTAGYVAANQKAADLLQKIETHLHLCDNEATALQYQILAAQLPSMNQRIADAYKNTRDFVNHIQATLPTAKINFVSEELAAQGFTPSVFSLDLPTHGDTPQEKETNKRARNHKLIKLMISNIPTQSKYCVSYGQLQGCYWTIPATSTQGTTKEGDKDYIARVAVSPDLDLEKHKKVFSDFVESL